MASSAVNRPTNTKLKEEDVNRKLQLFGIYSAFAKGKAPSNKQIDVAMNSALESKPLAKPSNKLSDEGRVLVADVRDVIEKAKVLLLSKNEGNILQDFIWQCQQITGGDATKPNAPIDKETAQQHGQEALEGLRTLGTLLITNGQFRKLLNDFVILARDIAGDGAQNAAAKLNPTEDQLNQIDRPADDNTWHEAPDFKGMKDRATETINQNKPFAKKEAQNAADRAQQSGDNQTAAQAVKDQAAANIPDETKDKAIETKNQLKEKSRSYIEDKVPKERREQTIWRLKKMVVEIQGHQDYQKAIETLLSLAETYQGHAKDVGGQSAGTVKGAQRDSGLQSAQTDLKTLIERFANGTSTDDLFDAINQIYKDADKDPELRGWFKEANQYIRKCLQQQGYIMQDAAKDEWDRLYEKGDFLLRERYRNHTDRIIDETKFLADQFDQDPQNKAFSLAIEKLFKDLGNDDSGKPAFKPHLIKDLTNVILPAFFENIQYVPIPRIEYSDSQVDAVIENLIVEGDNLAPNVFEFGSDNYWRWGRKQISNKNKNKVMMSVSGIQMDLRDVSYYIKKKQGFPSITDTGVMDIFLGGSGFSFKAQMETADSSDKNHFFKITKVEVDIKNMDIKLKKSKYKLLFSIVKPLLTKVMKPVLTKVLEAQIKQQINTLDAFMFDIHQEAKAAERQAKRNPDEAVNIYQRYYQAYQKKVLAGKEKTKAKVEDKKVNVAPTQHESMFKDIKLPGGISSKATEYRELAEKGEKWESPVFSIGSAKESAGLPAAAKVTRKPHNTAPSTVRGPGQVNGASTNFSSQVNQAFDGNAPSGATNVSSGLTVTDTGATTLGQNNPVLQGKA